MPYFPIFIDPAEKRCVVVGGGAVASRKAGILLSFGAKVDAIDPAPGAAIQNLAPASTLLKRTYAGPDDLTGALLVIAATNNRAVNRQVAEDAKSLGIPVNVADDPALCTFFFPGIVRRGAVVIGLSSSGCCPGLTARLRKLLESLISPDLGTALETLKTEGRRIKVWGGNLDPLITRIRPQSPDAESPGD
ncbi:MAG: bifunctional precorrin-2 dehydrogenase/sirohydrochlorin ferrochelatase [Spirochaetaceae bacterium]|jgi:siroheme synthase-like protein|nr:bifunctional precorrin-2 dehydrogenase/sirohydrochlorin ferrochelatase [Spirochaetaceae bacterium]